MNRNNIYTVNPLYSGQVTPLVDETTSGGTTIIYQPGGGGGGLTDALKLKLDGIQEGAEVNQNAYSKVRLNNTDTLIVEAKSKTATLNLSGVYPVLAAINALGGIDFTVSSDSTNTAAVVTQKQLADAIAKLEEDKYWKIDADGKLYTELDVYSQKEVSAYGAGTGGGGTGGASALYELVDVLRDGDKVQGAVSGSILSYNGSHWYAIPQSAITPDLTNYATKTYVSNLINELIGGAPGTLDTLKEIAEALGNDPNFAATMTDMINKIGIRVTDLEARMTSFDDMFEWDKTASASDASLWKIKAKKDLYGIGEISAYGYSSGTAPIGAQYMHELKDVLFTDLASGQLLQWNGTKWINIDKNAVGLNESELAKYLTTNNYAKKTDITWANLLNKPTTWAWTDITGKPTTLAGYGITDGVPNTRRVSAGSGLSGGGVLSSDVTISLGAIGTAGTYTKVTTDMYGRVVSNTTLSESDIPTLLISKISGLQSALDSKLSTSDFSTWFTINKNASGQIVSILANFDFFGVGEISAYGLGETQPSIYTLAGLDDVTITSPSNGQTLIYDSTTSQWKNGTIIGGGNISLNGTVYSPVDGTITLPNLATPGDITTALNGYATQAWVGSLGFLTTASLGNYVTLNTNQNITSIKAFTQTIKLVNGVGGITLNSSSVTDSDLIVGNFPNTSLAYVQAKGFKTESGTATQFLKANGSVDSNLYALAYKSNQNKVFEATASDTLNVTDKFDYANTPDNFDSFTFESFISNKNMPSSTFWSGINVAGWDNRYQATWQLVGPSGTSNYDGRLYYRVGAATVWKTDWKALAFLEEVDATGKVYFNQQNIYVDYGYWVVGLCKLTPTTTNAGINGVMYYNRTNGIYGAGSVQFTINKQYAASSAYASVLYNGYSTSTDEVAPKLCTFTYNGVKYAGLRWASAASLNTIKTIVYETWGNDAPFYVLYSRNSNADVINAEIKNSVVELGNDINLYNISTSCGLFTSANKGIEIAPKDNAWAYTRYRTNSRFVDVGLSGISAGLAGQTGNFEIRPGGNDNEGVFVRYSGSSYGKFAVVNKNGEESSIAYYNNINYTGNKPVWTVGAGMRNVYSFDWWYLDTGIKMTMDSEGKLFVNRKVGDDPTISLAIGDSDTGLHNIADGQIAFYSNNKNIGYWNSYAAALHNVSFREASGNDYTGLGIMINGNGTANTVKPGIGFHQPGVYAGSLRLDGAGSWVFCVQGGSIGGQVQAGSFYANGGLLYSNNNGCQAVFGSQNTGFVHITNNATRKYYFDNSIAVSGTVYPYSDNAYDLGISTQKWNYIWGNHFMGNSASSTFIQPNYIGGQQANPQTYFNNSMGVKVAMTGTPTTGAYWSDTLWINGYGGTDVPSCNALHFPRDGSSEMYISSQAYNATAYGTKYRFWSSKNSNKSDVDWICRNLSCSDSNATTAYASNWFRSRGQTGWYSQDYSGGIYMTDSEQVRVYNNKVLYNDGSRSWGIGGHFCALKLYNASHIGLNLANNSYTWGIYSNNNGNMYIGRRDGNVNNTTGTYVVTIGLSTFSMSGNIVASGEVTAYSDVRLKSSITDLKIRGRLNPKTYVKDGKWSIGFIAQEVQALYPELIQIGESKEHYLSLNYGNITAVLAAQINSVEDEVTILKSKVEQLELEVIRLTSVNTYKR